MRPPCVEVFAASVDSAALCAAMGRAGENNMAVVTLYGQ